MLHSFFEEEGTRRYTKCNSFEPLGLMVIADFFNFNVFFPEKSGNISVLFCNPTCRKAFQYLQLFQSIHI